ncbi:MAG: GHKL domain-containing protein [Desulfuromonadales bacterium]|nr:GHKL domain-containing protein [Desulfuromonadales bacterium]
MQNKKIRRKVLVPLTLTFIILIAAFLYTSYRIRTQDYAARLTSRYERVQSILQSLVATHTSSMNSIVAFITDQQRFQNAMLNLDREQLLQHGSLLLDRLYLQQQITHFYFHDRNGHNFLRVYQPENISEAPHRFTMQRAMAEDHPVAGLELGGNGTFTLRLVYPWHVGQELIGYIELGQEIDPILRELKNATDIDFLVTIDKEFLVRNSWEEGMRMLGRSANWNILNDKVLIDQTVTIPEDSAAIILSDDAISQEQGSLIKIEGRTFRGRSFPLQDAAQRTVGDFVLLHDITEDVIAFRTFITQVVAFSLLLSTCLFAFAYRILGRVDKQLADSQDRLQQELENQAKTNEKLEIEVTERRRAEDELTRLNEHLERRVTERTRELHTLNLEIETGRMALEEAYKNLQAQQATILQQGKMACIGQLAAGVAHDINNPIGFVAGNLEVLEDFWKKVVGFVEIQSDALQKNVAGDNLVQVTEARKKLKINYIFEELPAVMAECFEGTDRVNRIVLNLKGFSRIDETEARLADIHECLESTIGIVRNELRYKADLKKHYGQLPQLFCHPQQLNQVFMNLLLNAAQAIERWGEISIKTWADENNIYVAIGDTGGGISPENLTRIFEPFFTTKDTGVGTGLGLSIVYDIIKKHRGEIRVASEVNQGTAFTIRLPLYGLESTNA